MAKHNYILAPLEILRNAIDSPGTFILRAEGLFCRKYDVGIKDDQIRSAMDEFDVIKKSGCKIPITYEMVQFVSKTNDSFLVFDDTKRLRTEATIGLLALSSISGRKGGWCKTNNKHFIARMAGYNTWQDFEEAGEEGILSGCYRMSESTLARYSNTVKHRIATTFENVQFRESPNRRGWEFTTNKERI